MPTYSYHCNACNHQFDLFHSIKDGAKRKCPKCNKVKLVRLISSGGGVIFKGDGWYRSIDYINSKARDNSSGKVGIN